MNEAEDSTAEIRIVERDDRRWWPIAVSVGTSVLSAVLTVALLLNVISNEAEQERELREELTAQFCTLVVAFDDNFKEKPPPVDPGKANAAAIAVIRAGFCHSTP